MDKDLKQFENRSDDWLAKERKEEDKVSAWDFDEGKKIKEFHEENCEARQIKERHEQIHKSAIANKNIPKKGNPGSLIIFILTVVVITEFIGPLISGENIPTEIIPTIVMIIFISIIVKNNRRKK